MLAGRASVRRGFIAPAVTGTDLASVSVTAPSIPITIELVEVGPGEFVCSSARARIGCLVQWWPHS